MQKKYTTLSENIHQVHEHVCIHVEQSKNLHVAIASNDISKLDIFLVLLSMYAAEIEF